MARPQGRETTVHGSVRASTSDSLRDHFLLAMPGLDAGLFSGSITYICEHGEAGAMGLVINQPLDLTLEEIFDHLDIAVAPNFVDRTVLAGGPVQVDHGFVLHPPDDHSNDHPGDRDSWDCTLRVTDRMRLTTSQDVLRAIAAGDGPADYLIALGYAGWSAGQLEEEIASNSWLTLPADHRIIFDTPIEQRVSAAASALGVDMNLMSTQAGHA